MYRRYLVSDDLDELKAVEQDLYLHGFSAPQVHVLTERYAEIDKYHFNDVNSLSKSDVVHSGLVGATVGIVLSVICISLGFIFGAQNSIQWLPYIFIAIILLGFCTWEGGLIGIQLKNKEFQKFDELLNAGKHVMLVDMRQEDSDTVTNVIKSHSKIKNYGVGNGAPSWLVRSQNTWRQFIREMP